MTQCELVLRHMEDCGSITSLEAMQEYGIMRLASRISDLKNAGYPIRREMVSRKNRYGDTITFPEQWHICARTVLNPKREAATEKGR